MSIQEQYQRYKIEIDKIKNNLSAKHGIPIEELDDLIENVRQIKFKELDLVVKKTHDYKVHRLLTLASINAGTEYNLSL